MVCQNIRTALIATCLAFASGAAIAEEISESIPSQRDAYAIDSAEWVPSELSEPAIANEIVEEYSLKQTDPLSGIDYATGGIGKDEVAYFKSVRSQYNTQLLFAEHATGAFLSEVVVTVADQKTGEQRFSGISEGPYYFLDLPKGSYTLTAQYEGEFKQQKIRVSASQSPREYRFIWKPQPSLNETP